MNTRTAAAPVVALTGASGFIGRRLVPALHRAGWQVRLLLRRDPVYEQWQGVTPQIVAGDLRDPRTIAPLVQGVSAVVHVAGLIKAARREQFLEINQWATAALCRAVTSGNPAAHFLHVSTIAAREPQLSDYARSKRAGEQAVVDCCGERATIIRPPAVYGPGDRETLVFFQLAARRRVPVIGSSRARVAMIHVDDLVALLVAQLAVTPSGSILTAADERPEGYSWREVMASAAAAAGNAAPRFFQVPRGLLRVAALAGDLARMAGSANMLNSQKLRELRHPDWSVNPAELAQPPGWRPRFSLDTGFAHAVGWYRQSGWLKNAPAP